MIDSWRVQIGRALFWAFISILLTSTAIFAQHDGAITSPSPHAVVSGTVAIEGFATHPTFRKWQLDLLLYGDADRATFLALGEKPLAAPSQLLLWDTTPYPNGEHVLRLRVVHSNLNYEEIFTPIVIANHKAAMLAEKPEIAAVETKPETASQEKGSDEPVIFRADASSDGERWIEVIVSEQKLIAWQGDTPVFETIVSTGKPGFETLPGEFRIYVKYDKTRMRGPGYDTPDVPWTLYYYRGFAIHGAYWHNNFGTPVSHGCVNLRVPEAKALYDWASVGTRVVVRP